MRCPCLGPHHTGGTRGEKTKTRAELAHTHTHIYKHDLPTGSQSLVSVNIIN